MIGAASFVFVLGYATYSLGRWMRRPLNHRKGVNFYE